MKRIILLLTVFNLFAICAIASKDDGETRTATVKMDVRTSDLINIKAKNTDLVIEAWDKNEVEVVATIRYDGKMNDKMTRFLDEFEMHVNNNIQYESNELYINTNLDEPNKVQIGSKHVGIIIGFSDDELKLEYKIKAPSKNPYKINHSYEDLDMIGTFDEVDLTQYSADLTAEAFKNAELNMKYGSATFTRLDKGEMEIYEQEIDVNSIGSLELNTKYSELEIEEVGELDATSYESDFVFKTVDRLSGGYKYGKIEIEEEITEAEFQFYEMEFEAKTIGDLRLNESKYSKYRLGRANKVEFEQSYEDETDIDELGSFESRSSKYGEHEIGTLQSSFILDSYEDEVDIQEVKETAERITLKGKYIDAFLGAEGLSFNIAGNVKYGKVNYDKSLVDVKRYIKDGDQLEVEVASKKRVDNPLSISVNGYEIDVTID